MGSGYPSDGSIRPMIRRSVPGPVADIHRVMGIPPSLVCADIAPSVPGGLKRKFIGVVQVAGIIEEIDSCPCPLRSPSSALR